MSAEATAPRAQAQGTAAPGFEPVLRTLERCVEEFDEIGCAVHVHVHGQPVVDAWVGSTATGDWESDTMVITYSCTKGVAALGAQLLYDRGLLEPDAPVGRYWPEYATAGKEAALVGHLLDHSSGSITFPDYTSVLGLDVRGLLDWNLVTSSLASSRPGWEPGTQAWYHALTYGHLVGELIRRVDGRTIGAFFREELAQPLDLDFHIGVTDADLTRVAPIHGAPIPDPARMTEEEKATQEAALQIFESCRSAILRGEIFSPEAIPWSSIFYHPDGENYFNVSFTPDFLRAEIPGAGGVGTARALSRLYAPLANQGVFEGRAIVSPQSIERFSRRRSDVPGATPFGLGYQLLGAHLGPYGASMGSFGHTGAGGNLGFADPERGVSMGFVKNRSMANATASLELVRSVYACL